jgi:DhnA family fructose-bisphosphate aldolase class Ia
MLNPSKPRLNRLFAADGKCFDVAIDHGFFNELSFLAGIEDIRKAIETVVAAAPDAVQLPPGTAPILQSISGAKPALVLRTDVANVYGTALPRTLMSELISDAVDQAVRLDAACVVVNLLLLPNQPELHRDCVRNVNALKSQAYKAGMPLMVEPLVMKDSSAGGYTSDGELEKVVPLVRQAIELGADVIKADPTDNAADYHHVIQTAGSVPVLVRGGGRVSDEDLLNRTAEVLKQGAAGIVYGRNIIAHPKPAKMTQALMAMLHNGTSAADALKIVNS